MPKKLSSQGKVSVGRSSVQGIGKSGAPPEEEAQQGVAEAAAATAVEEVK